MGSRGCERGQGYPVASGEGFRVVPACLVHRLPRKVEQKSLVKGTRTETGKVRARQTLDIAKEPMFSRAEDRDFSSDGGGPSSCAEKVWDRGWGIKLKGLVD